MKYRFFLLLISLPLIVSFSFAENKYVEIKDIVVSENPSPRSVIKVPTVYAELDTEAEILTVYFSKNIGLVDISIVHDESGTEELVSIDTENQDNVSIHLNGDSGSYTVTTRNASYLGTGRFVL